MNVTLYGIPNCDTVKKARKWLDTNGIEYQFHDFRQDGLTRAKVNGWLERAGWENVLNRRSTTWRQLDDAVKAQMDSDSARQQVLATPTLIKRPVLEYNGQLHIGFKESDYAELFN